MNDLETILDACTDDPFRGVPCLVGPTRWGKTHAVLAWALGRARHPVMVNPQCDLPEDIAGWPVRNGHALGFTQPSVIPADYLERSDWVLFVDELDKAREDTLSALLTLANPAERRLRHTRLPEGVPVVFAMNEPLTPLPEPLLARMLFVPYPLGSAAQVVDERADLRPLAHLAKRILPTLTVAFPARPVTPDAFHRLARWVQVSAFWERESLRELVVRGLFPEHAAAAVLAGLQEQVVLPGEVWARTVTPQALPEQFLRVLNGCDIATRGQVLRILIEERAQQDPTKEFQRVLYDELLNIPEIARAIGRAEAVDQAMVVIRARQKDVTPKGKR